MQAVILAGGKGARMGDLVKDVPKPLLKVDGKSLLEHKLDILVEAGIDEAVIVVGYKGEVIKESIGAHYKDLKIFYTEHERLDGTAGALWCAKNILKDRFIVMMGDDLYGADSVKRAREEDFSIVCKRAERDEAGSRAVLNEEGCLTDFVTHKLYIRDRDDGGLIFTGLYSLTKEIFQHEPVKLETKDEFGLPQTLLKLAKEKKIKIIETDFWLPVGTPEELQLAEEKFKSLSQ